MVVNKRKKSSRHRASWNHGWGSRKKHRGAGHRGGKGAAGSGKRSDHKKPHFWKKNKTANYFGKSGFKKKGRVNDPKTINVGYIQNHIEKLIANKSAIKEGDLYTIDLTKLGYGKLLGSGNAESKFKISVEEASVKAIEKIKSKGGEVIVTSKPTEEK